jgi:hypothetical protein
LYWPGCLPDADRRLMRSSQCGVFPGAYSIKITAMRWRLRIFSTSPRFH